MSLAARPRDPTLPAAAVLLTGPTASGKTGVAHVLAARLGQPVLSADSMLVYRGMDLGTAKPAPEVLARYRYAGLDLAEPSGEFSTGNYLDAVRSQLATAQDSVWIVCGGTGLYLTALVRGLDRAPGDPAVRRETEVRFAAGGVQALRDWLGEIAPDRLRALADPANPRRLARAIEQACAGTGPGSRARTDPIRVVGLQVPPDQLVRRIRDRIEHMLRDGWIEEVRRLRSGPALSRTAATAIGYRELADVLDGKLDLDTAREAIGVRTRQYARRQMTWIRHQFDTVWVDASDGRSPERIADDIERMARDRADLPLAGLADRNSTP